MLIIASSEQFFELWPVLVFAAFVFLIVGGMLGASYFLGQRHNETQTDTIFESGIKSTNDARLRFPVHFYIVAMFFVIFDLEAAFIISWAIAFRKVGWGGYIGVLIFIFILLVVLLYEWRIGALDFGPKGKKILKKYYERIKR